MPTTKKELARLVRKARSYGTFGRHQDEAGTWAMVCPVMHEAMAKASIGHFGGVHCHKFPVHHLPWEDTPTVALVTKALAAHLADAEENDEWCGDLSKAAR